MSPAGSLPPLVLRCHTGWRLACGGAALVLLGLGAAVLSTAPDASEGRGLVLIAAAVLLFGSGGACVQFLLFYGLARLTLDDRGFCLRGVLRPQHPVAWSEVLAWERAPWPMPPRVLRVVHGTMRRRLSVPMIYEDSHLLEIGLMQRGFPRW